MRRTTAIMLLVMGGAGVAAVSSLSPSQACRDARVAQRADADAICRSRSGGGYFGGGRSAGAASADGHATAASATARGGFGSFGAHMASGG